MTPDRRSNLLKFGFLCALVCWQLNMFYAYVADPFLQGDGLSWRRSQTDYFGSDFLHYYVSGVMARSPDSKQIYDVPVHFPYINALIAPREIKRDSCINFSPPMIVIMSVVSLLPVVIAYLTWLTASISFGVTALVLLMKRVGNLSNYSIAVFIIGASSCLCSLLSIKMGQWTWWLIGFLSFFILLSQNNKQFIPGVLLGLFAVKPQYSVPVFVITAIEKRWLTLLVAGATLALLNACAIPLIGLDNVIHFPQIVVALSMRPDLLADNPNHASLRGLISQLLPVNTAVTVTSALFFAAMAAFGAFCFFNRKLLAEKQYWFYAIAILIAIIFAPLMFQYDASLVFIVGALTLKTLDPREMSKLKSLPLQLWHWIFLLYPLFILVKSFLGNGYNYLYSFMNLALLACALVYVKQKPVLGEPTENRAIL